MNLPHSRESRQSRWLSEETAVNGEEKMDRAVSAVFSPTGTAMVLLVEFLRSFRPSFVFIAQPTAVPAPSACRGARPRPHGRQGGRAVAAGQPFVRELFQSSGSLGV